MQHPLAGSPIFVSGKEGYDCFRIPGMVALANNVLLAFAEGRKYSCADHDWNDIVMKRSVDGGKTWAPLVVIISESSPSDHVTDGNPAPVALTNGKPGLVVMKPVHLLPIDSLHFPKDGCHQTVAGIDRHAVRLQAPCCCRIAATT